MSKTLLHPMRWLACFLMFNLIAIHPAQAEPATKESLNKYFEVNNVPDLVKRAVESVAGVQAKAWQDETDPAAKAKKKAQFDKVDAIVRKYITWKALEPIALASYQRRLEEADVRALIAYSESPGGQVHIKKLAPGLIATVPALLGHIDKRVDEIVDRKEGAPAPAPAKMQKPAAGSKEALAYTLLTETPGSREEYKHRMAGMEKAMLQAAEMFGAKGDKKMTASMKRHAANIQREISYEELISVQAKALADQLTEAEFNILITEHRQPALNKLLGKQMLANREFGESANKFMSEEIMPTLMGEMMVAMQPDESEPAADKK